MTPEEALIQAIEFENSRIPEWYRGRAGVADPAAAAAAILAGEKTEDVQRLFDHLRYADPDFVPGDDDFMAAGHQAAVLKNYPGRAWREEDVAALGRDPEPYELSPGGMAYSDYIQRRDLIQKMFDAKPTSTAAWAGGQNLDAERQGFADAYERNIGRTHAPSWSWESLNSPESYLGYYMGKMGPAISDAFAHGGTASIAGEADGVLHGIYKTGAGDAAVRASAKDWNRVNPVMLGRDDQGGLERDRYMSEMRAALNDSEAPSSHDYIRKSTGVDSTKVPYLGRLATMAASLGNSLLDGSFGANPFSKGTSFAGAIGREAVEEGITDGGIQVGVDLLAGDSRPVGESGTEFDQRFADESARREKAIKTLEANQGGVYHQPTTVWKGLTGSLLGPGTTGGGSGW